MWRHIFILIHPLAMFPFQFIGAGVVVVGGGRVFLGPRDQIFTKSISNGVNSSG